ncbi:hypothetical protein [Streptomyces sp. HUAS TT20]|uniref:hypothetical protein n=1 Tax=Streptomyces sp. HUAS TT20 TaxID=3447509 RepID=UPI0021D80DD5|nr:hypothetical protein [Streptomyces sp. HUAS 15-9]UXY32413.1 hypothetical protein N8I87_41975 [Streptomyces sp. HUAS 15-9]
MQHAVDRLRRHVQESPLDALQPVVGPTQQRQLPAPRDEFLDELHLSEASVGYPLTAVLTEAGHHRTPGDAEDKKAFE